jgi:hypothetical protein
VLTALAARAKLRAWHDVDALFTTKVSALELIWADEALGKRRIIISFLKF